MTTTRKYLFGPSCNISSNSSEFFYPNKKNDGGALVRAALSLFTSSVRLDNDCLSFLNNCSTMNDLMMISDVDLLGEDAIFEGAETLVLYTIQNDVKGEWFGTGEIDDVFFPQGNNDKVELSFATKSAYCASDAQTSSVVETTLQFTEINNSFRDVFTYLDNNNSNLIIFSNTSLTEEFRMFVGNQIVFHGTCTIGIDFLSQGIYWLSFASAKGILTKKILKH